MKVGLREVVFIILLMLIPLGAWWFVFRPHNERNTAMRLQIEARQSKLRQLNKTISTIGHLEQQIGSLSEAIKYFESKLPQEKEIDKILQDIWRLAESNNLHTKSIRPRTRKANNCFLPEDSEQAEQPIAVQLEGDFMGFYSFLTALENRPRIMRIRTMKLKTKNKSSAKDKSPAGHITVEFEMSIFFERNHEDRPWPQKS